MNGAQVILETEELLSVEAGAQKATQWVVVWPSGKASLLRIKQASGRKSRVVDEREARHWFDAEHLHGLKFFPIHERVTLTPNADSLADFKAGKPRKAPGAR